MNDRKDVSDVKVKDVENRRARKPIQLEVPKDSLGPVLDNYFGVRDRKPEIEHTVALWGARSVETLTAHLALHGLKPVAPTKEYLPLYGDVTRFIRLLENRCSPCGLFHVAEVFHIYNWLNVQFVDSLAHWLSQAVKGNADVVEICAGDGLLSHWLMKKAFEMPIRATDSDTTATNHYTKADHSLHVEQIDAMDAMKKYNPKVVIASWIPYENDIASEIIEYPSVTDLVWIGERAGGCCGTEKIWEYPNEDLEATRYVISRTDYMMLNTVCRHGSCTVFHKKP